MNINPRRPRRTRILWTKIGSGLLLLFGIQSTSLAGSLILHPKELVIYTDDRFRKSEGLGKEIYSLFENQHHCRIHTVHWGEAGQLFDRIQRDSQQNKNTAHIALGIDQFTWSRAKIWVEPWGDWQPQGYSEIPSHLKLEEGFLPFNYGIYAFLANQKLLKKLNLKIPSSLLDLTASEWRRNLILEDPRTSASGLSFLLYTQKVLGDPVWKFWTGFKNQWLTLTPGWSSAYRLFLKEESPLVWTYLSSQAFQEEKGNSLQLDPKSHQAIVFQEGHPFQVEGVILVRSPQMTPEMKKLAQSFLEFLISPEVQKRIPQKLWVNPVRSDVALPVSFQHLPSVKKLIFTAQDSKEIAKILHFWKTSVYR